MRKNEDRIGIFRRQANGVFSRRVRPSRRKNGWGEPAVDGIADSIDRYLPRDLVLDLTQLGFMDSSGIAVIVRSYKKMRSAGGRMYIENPQKQPLKVLDASGIDRMIPIAAKREVTT